MSDIYFPGMDQPSEATASTDQNIYFPGMDSSSSQTPQDVLQAQGQMGSQDENGECQQFVEQMTTGHSGIFPSATAAANYYQQNGQMKPISQAKPGDMIYFSDPSQPDGHVGIISDTNGDFVSATYNGVQTNNLQSWLNETGQQVLGVVTPGGTQ